MPAPICIEMHPDQLDDLRCALRALHELDEHVQAVLWEQVVVRSNRTTPTRSRRSITSIGPPRAPVNGRWNLFNRPACHLRPRQVLLSARCQLLPGLVEAHGTGRGRVYTLSAAVYRTAGEPAEYVRQVGFDRIQQEQRVLAYVREHGGIRRADVVELCRVTSDQAKRLLVRLVEAGSPVREGAWAPPTGRRSQKEVSPLRPAVNTRSTVTVSS